MLTFYRNAVASFIALLLLSALILFVGYKKSQLNVSLFPGRDENFLWRSAIEPKEQKDLTQLKLKTEVGNVEYDYFLDPTKPFPYTHYSIYFIDTIQSFQQIDLRSFSNISFKVACDPKNVLLLVLFTFDDKVTRLDNLASRRVSSAAFSCKGDWSTVTIKFDALDTPTWWLQRYGFEYSDHGFQLEKAMGFAWVNSLQSPLNTPSSVKLTDIKLGGTDYRYIAAVAAMCIILWIGFFVWQFRVYILALTHSIQERVKHDQTFMAYKRLSIDPSKDKEKNLLLHFIATEYANSELSLDIASSTLGINRTKINDLLKEELGITFSVYLNKLRLTEAARLLSETKQANISEIAYLVGYNNVTYFNKLFKQEYGVAPKIFKTLSQSETTPTS
jgi:AraC-like DNA-binding protein